MITRLLMSLAALYVIGAPASADQGPPAPFMMPGSATHTLVSSDTGRTYPVHVALPPGYEAEDETLFPVLIANDGPYAFPIAAQSLSVPMNTGALEPAIVVAIGYAEGDDQMVSRMRDYTPTVDEAWSAFELGEADAYADFIAKDVLPFLEATYRVDPSSRTLVGHSAGALFGSWILLNRSDLFQNYILISSAWFWDDALMLAQEQAYANDHEDLQANVYIAVGSDERPPYSPFPWVETHDAFVQQLQGRGYQGLQLEHEVIDGALHETVFPQGLIRGAQWLLTMPADVDESK
ncbi:alpha/beta hydrolase [Oceanicaulis sp. MMSF_3324]|uniref:alpha/beta hydrolase n=1 Tax=Oceanicaulis sp. MMSF_3324 TaxID=3046702 RepID=UPI00273FB91A|nr:alpha/beta hydrolase-fold protein [Oceanicaulis sp. MMSF_3324]